MSSSRILNTSEHFEMLSHDLSETMTALIKAAVCAFSSRRVGGANAAGPPLKCFQNCLDVLVMDADLLHTQSQETLQPKKLNLAGF